MYLCTQICTYIQDQTKSRGIFRSILWLRQENKRRNSPWAWITAPQAALVKFSEHLLGAKLRTFRLCPFLQERGHTVECSLRCNLQFTCGNLHVFRVYSLLNFGPCETILTVQLVNVSSPPAVVLMPLCDPFPASPLAHPEGITDLLSYHHGLVCVLQSFK